MIRRGYSPKHTECPAVSVPSGWLQSWSPTEADLLINRQRIAERQPKS
jgi:hypothetical protein